jgi:hypothetical protein
MKGKIMVALVILALVFGMVLTACDDGELPKIKQGDNETIGDITLLGDLTTDPDTNQPAYINKDGKLLKAKDDTSKAGYVLNEDGEPQFDLSNVIPPQFKPGEPPKPVTPVVPGPGEGEDD